MNHLLYYVIKYMLCEKNNKYPEFTLLVTTPDCHSYIVETLLCLSCIL